MFWLYPSHVPPRLLSQPHLPRPQAPSLLPWGPSRCHELGVQAASYNLFIGSPREAYLHGGKGAGLSNQTCDTRWKMEIFCDDQIRWKTGILYLLYLLCTSVCIQEKGPLKYQQSSLFGLKNSELILTEFYLPKCLVLLSERPYFKLQVNLLQIHR